MFVYIWGSIDLALSAAFGFSRSNIRMSFKNMNGWLSGDLEVRVVVVEDGLELVVSVKVEVGESWNFWSMFSIPSLKSASNF